VSKSVVPEVIAYVDNQRAHHRQRDFAGELAALLSRHGIDFDPRHYLG
jgi:hypothetical protein